ncbi:MAG: rod shape-determining protein MreC [Thermoleophilaceae bacterium]
MIRRRRATLGVLVGISLVLITVYFSEGAGGALHAVQRGAQEALAPIETGAGKVLKPFRDLANWVGDVVDAKGENEKLRTENERLQKSLARAEVAARDGEQARSLVGLAEFEGYPDGVDPVTARVIVRSPTVWYSAVQIDKGSSDGVEVNMPVVAASEDPEGTGGLAGRVVSVTSGTARVMLITDADSGVGSEVFPGGESGVVRPEVGKPTDLLLDFIETGRRIEKGNTVITSGFGSRDTESHFPRGIPIGVVRRVDQSELDLYQRVHLRPFADLRRMDVVQVLRPAGRGERAEVGAE